MIFVQLKNIIHLVSVNEIPSGTGMLRKISPFLSYYLEALKYRPKHFVIRDIIVTKDGIMVEYKTSTYQLSAAKREKISEITLQRHYFDRTDKLKIDACNIAEEMIENARAISTNDAYKDKFLLALYPRIARYLNAKVEL